MIKVYNLATGEEQYYSDATTTPHEAVRMAYLQAEGLGTQAAVYGPLKAATKYAHDVPAHETETTITFGDWTTLKDDWR